MKNLGGILMMVAGLACTTAMAQPTLTALGGGSANNITNSTGGIIYLGGGSASGQVARWAFNPAAGTLTQLTVGGSGNGRVSADGQFLVGWRVCEHRTECARQHGDGCVACIQPEPDAGGVDDAAG